MNNTKKKWVIPVIAMIGALFLVTVITYPMMSMQVKDIPVGIISTDKGMTTSAGNVNAGDEVVKNISRGGEGVIAWEKIKTEKALKKNFDDGDYYAIFVIPEDFTAKALTGGEKTMEVTVNQGKNPMVSMQMTNMLEAMSEKAGLNLNIKNINETGELGFRAMLLPMVCILIAFISSLITAFITTKSVGLEGKGKRYGIQAVYMAIESLIIGYTSICIVDAVMDINLDIGQTGLFIAMLAFAIMLLVNGAVNLLGKKGIAIPVILFALGMALINLPYEFIPRWWQVLVASWEPLRYFGEGTREVIYANAGIWNSASVAMILVAAVGILLSLTAIVQTRPKKQN